MAIKTPIYEIEAFTRGETYSAEIDQRRFLIIDGQLAFITDLIGDGRIDGWNVTVVDEPTLTVGVSPGIGIIDRFVTRTLNDLTFVTPDDQTVFVYMRRKPDVIGGTSEFSNLAGFINSDSTAPAAPTGLTFTTVTFNSIGLDWDDNTEADIGTYSVLRSTNGIDFTEVASVTESNFTDTGLAENTVYYYKLKAVDLSGNESAETSSEMTKTLKDLRVPLPPSGFQLITGDQSLKLFWVPSSFGNLDRYEASIQELDASLKPVGSPFVQTTSTDNNFMIIDNLKNNTPYEVTLFAVSINNIRSDGDSQVRTPKFFKGPAEVDDFSVTFSEGETDSVNVIMTVSWTPPMDPYNPEQPDRYQITLIENGSRETEPIVVRNAFTRDIRVVNFVDEEGVSTFESIKPVTRYFVIIQSVDILGRVSPGVATFVESPSFTPPNPVTAQQSDIADDRTIVAQWTNSTSNLLDHNEITVVSIDAITSDETTLFSNSDIGISNSFILDSSNYSESTTYRFTIVAVDRFGNRSDPAITSVSTISSEGFSRPDPPPNQTAISGDGSITLKWSLLDEGFIQNYRIWRAPFGLFTTAEAFSIIDTVPNNISEYTDYDVENGESFMYFVTAIDIFNQESENPVEDGFVSYNLISATASASGSFVPPEDLAVVKSGFDAVLTWTPTVGAFDGYEIFFSEDNRYSFEKIGSADASDTSFTHEDVLLKDGVTYYYLVRKIRNEADVFVTSSNVVPLGSTIIAEVTATNGSISINEEPAIELKNMEDPVRTETRRQLAAHRHFLESDGTDKRIDLSSDVEVTEWTTIDFQNYTTEEDLEGASAYVVSLEGDINNAFFVDDAGNTNETAVNQLSQGVSPFLFEVDADAGRITFDTPLFTRVPNAVAPFNSPPTLKVTMLDIREVQGILPASRVGEISGTQVTSGQLKLLQVPDIHHDGRLDQRFTYEFLNSASMDSTRTFYDLLKVQGNQILAATSQGILLSYNFAVSWGAAFETTTAPNKLFFATAFNKYMALTSDSVFVSSGDLGDWTKMGGLENTKVIRDIIQDQFGNVYVSTDLGVYKLEIGTISEKLSWTQTPLFGARSTESYALLRDTIDDRLLVSNELGILESTNQGASWTFTDDFEETDKIFVFIQENNRIFALTNTAIWRKSPSAKFVKIVEFDSDIARKMVIYNDRLYVTTEDGTFASDVSNDIYGDSSITMRRVLPEVNINNNVVPVTSLNVIDDLLFVGTDQRLFVRDEDNVVWIQSEFIGGKIPSVFVNDELQQIGFRYFPPRNRVSFDEKLDESDIVTVAVQYTDYRAKNGGWATQKFDSDIEVRQNNAVLTNTKDEGTQFTIDISEFTGFQFPEFNETNSYPPGATAAKTATEEAIDTLESATTDLAPLVADVYNNIERFFSQTYKDLRTAQLPLTDEEQAQVDAGETVAPRFVDLPDIVIDIGNGITVNVQDGIFTFTQDLNKYDFMVADILGATVSNIGSQTHRELEDGFELFNSGLPSSLSRVQQSNVLKLGIFNEKQWPGQQAKCNESYQAKYIVPRNQRFYDVLNSSVDYELQNSEEEITFTLPYAATAVYVESTNRVLVGGRGGILGIDADNLDIDEVSIPEDGTPIIKQLHFANGILYAVTESNIFESSNGGGSWTRLARNGLPTRLFSIGLVNNTLVVGAEDGVYFKSLTQDTWSQALESVKPVEVIIDPDFLFAIVDDQVYLSSNGSSFVKTGQTQSQSIYALTKYNSLIFAATNQGLRKDDSTFYGGGARLSIADVLDDTEESAKLVFNDVDGDGTRLVGGISDGSYVVLEDDVYTVFTDEPLETIQKVLIVKGGIWLFGFDLFTVPFLDHPVKLTTGVPI